MTSEALTIEARTGDATAGETMQADAAAATVDAEVVRKHAAPLPRYTSYPTAPHFRSDVQGEQYGSWLAELPADTPLSLYFHIPFCHALCWYCGCTTKATARYEPVKAYLDVLLKEIRTVAALLKGRREVRHIHWGGGSPNILSATDIHRLDEATRKAFYVAPDVEFAVEIDPRDLSDVQVQALRQAGVTRLSVGVQDFSIKVQEAINRRQGYEDTRRAIDMFRSAGVGSVNIDLVYGLPHQTRRSVTETIEKVITLRPDRIAIFGYAHLPSRFSHQRLIENDTLPGAEERFDQARTLAETLRRAGYSEIGLDHFALKSDGLATEPIKRNFQGYTTDSAEALLGLGLSSIGRLPQGYAQNATTMAEYKSRIDATGLATVRGIALSEDDRMRADVIERLMCDFAFSRSRLSERYGAAAAQLFDTAETIIGRDSDGLIERTEDGFSVTERGRPFIRSICAGFDAYLGSNNAKHAPGV